MILLHVVLEKLLKAKLIDIDNLPAKHKELKDLSRTLKGEIPFADFIEAYSMDELKEVDFR